MLALSYCNCEYSLEWIPVGHGYLVKVGVLSVEEVGVGSPDLGEELPVHGQLLQVRPVVLQPSVNPVLPTIGAVDFLISF